MTTVPHHPVATYRVQLTPTFTFAEVVGILDHLVDLGISHLYLSPILTAMPGSTHGYDWCPPARISPALGGEDGYRLLRAHARAVGIGIVLDIVPNHVGIGDAHHNHWWADVMRRGSASPYAEYFDLDLAFGDGLLCLPWLPVDGDLSPLRIDADAGELWYGDRYLPTADGTLRVGDDPLAVLARQAYRLVPCDSRQIGYRRFLAVNELAALRQEVPAVYDATHAWLRELAAEDLFDGVRVDHLDGLTDPVGYCRRLRTDIGDRLLYVEKGLGVGERLDPVLPVDGTTGYDQLRLIEGAFTPPSGAVELSELFQRITGISGDGDGMTARADDLRHVTLIDVFSDRVRRTTALFSATAPDVPVHKVQQAVTTFITRVRLARPDYPSLRHAALDEITQIRADNPSMSDALDVLSYAFVDRSRAPEGLGRLGEAVAAVTAKAIEDIGYHRTSRLVSANEIGCTPAAPSVNRDEFHGAQLARVEEWPLGLTTLSTHDTKRSEDVRARIAMTAQTPQRWTVLVLTLWRIMPPPDAMTGYFLLQNLIGVWPDEGRPDETVRTRMRAYARKAMREGGLVSSWTDVDEAGENAMIDWIDALQCGVASDLIAEYVAVVAPPARDESVSRKTMSLLLPGVGDVYQGTQWWSDSLTDPDNRRPVDYTRSLDDPKTRMIRTALDVRRRHPESFGPGSTYLPVIGRGRRGIHLVAFARGDADGDPRVLFAGMRLAHTFRPVSVRDDALLPLPAGLWRDAVTGADHTGQVTASALLGDRPAVVLEKL
ncbi:malto-oligosyltrehalose synthase [Gordonia humi]|uniref:(1->4)-alpha-D-glucan 1-alpha-D-glucosylmutase n=1 Tax=Gordonia humi TaxID=686429 RepID=A0A840F2Z8_9ACTN|nr:malto-oligosyltrehalose synthase [Gordonia humi]MBB4136853.1 (1->4)-alpha-D-glucan 1-alpha-D-glucosylmutase [Gordonia humi]